MEPEDVDDLVTRIDQLKSADAEVNKVLHSIRNTFEKIKVRLKKQQKEKEEGKSEE